MRGWVITIVTIVNVEHIPNYRVSTDINRYQQISTNINRYQQYQPLVFLLANGIMSGSKASSTMSRCRASQFEPETDGNRFIDLDSPCHKPTKLTAVWDWMALVGLPQYGILGQKIACLHNHVLFDYYTTAILLAQPSRLRISAKVPAPKAAMASLGRWPLCGVQGLQQWMVDRTSGVLWVALGLSLNHFWIRLQRANTRQKKQQINRVDSPFMIIYAFWVE